jgi:hypothetical protein
VLEEKRIATVAYYLPQAAHTPEASAVMVKNPLGASGGAASPA